MVAERLLEDIEELQHRSKLARERGWSSNLEPWRQGLWYWMRLRRDAIHWGLGRAGARG